MKFCRPLALLLLPALPVVAAQTDTGSGEMALLSGRLEKQLAEISAIDAEIQSLSQRLGREGTPLPRRAPERPLPPPEPVPVQPVEPTPPAIPPEPVPSVRPAVPVPEPSDPPSAPVPPPVVVAAPPVAVPPPPPPPIPIPTPPVVAVAPPAPAPVSPPPVAPAPPAQPVAVIVPPPEPVPPVPVGGGENTPAIPLTSGGEYAVVAGDTLSSIARKHNISLAALQKANPGLDPSKLQLGQKLAIPGQGKPGNQSTAAPATPAPVTPVASGPLFYEVRPGDTLHGIARRAGTTVSSLSQENGITNPESLKIGQKLRLPAGSTVPVATPGGDAGSSPARPPTPSTHVVKPGETLSSISRETGTPLDELRKVNNLKDDKIHPGQSLKVRRGKPDSPSSTGDSGASATPLRPSGRAVMVATAPPTQAGGSLAQAGGSLAQATEMAEYTVKNGDSIFSIARRYFMSRDELAAMNHLPVDAPLQAGQKLRLPANLVAGARMAESESLAR